MTKLTRYKSFDELKASKNAEKPLPVGCEIKPAEFEELFNFLRNNLVNPKPVSTEDSVHEQ